MAGWIKVEKDLRQDPRVLRMARALERSYRLTVEGNAVPLPAVTLVLGALDQLWMYADSFARDDDTLDIGPDEINELTGIQKFAELMPREWLEILDSERVKLPGFHAHNGTDAKRKALTALRVARHRGRTTVTSVTQTVLPDQDQDQTKTETETQRGSGGDGTLVRTHASIPLEAWQEWLEHRRKHRWPMDPRTLRKQLAVLEPHPTAVQREIIDRSINAGWQGLFEPKGRGKRPYTPAPSTAELERLEAARLGITVEQLRERDANAS